MAIVYTQAQIREAITYLIGHPAQVPPALADTFIQTYNNFREANRGNRVVLNEGRLNPADWRRLLIQVLIRITIKACELENGDAAILDDQRTAIQDNLTEDTRERFLEELRLTGRVPDDLQRRQPTETRAANQMLGQMQRNNITLPNAQNICTFLTNARIEVENEQAAAQAKANAAQAAAANAANQNSDVMQNQMNQMQQMTQQMLNLSLNMPKAAAAAAPADVAMPDVIPKAAATPPKAPAPGVNNNDRSRSGRRPPPAAEAAESVRGASANLFAGKAQGKAGAAVNEPRMM